MSETTQVTEATKATTDIVIYIDGECNLCDWAARFAYRHSAPGQFRFALLQDHFSPHVDGSDTVKVTAGGKTYTGGKAVLFLMSVMHKPYPQLSRALQPLPLSLIEGLYRLIAYSRYWIWGRKVCSLPSELKDKSD